MTLIEFSDIVQSNIVVTRYHGQSDRWSARIEYAEIREGSCILASVSGEGTNEIRALYDYIEKIRGKTMILHAADPSRRREFGVPTTIDGLGARP